MGKLQKQCWCGAIAFLSVMDAAIAQQQFTSSTDKATEPGISKVSFLRNPFPVNNKMILQWKYAGSRLPEYFVIERSVDERHFKTIAVIRATNALGVFEFADEGATGAQSYYRIKGEGSCEPAVISSVIGAESMMISCKIYPNPVDRILIIRSEISGIVQLKDLGNNCRLTANLHKGLQHIDVSELESGIYVVTLYDRQTNKIFRQRLVKH